MQKTILFRGFIALAALSFTLTGHAQQKNNRQFLNIDEDSSVSPPQTYINYKSDSFYNIVLSGGKVTSMYVNGRQVPADRYHIYDDVIRRMKEQMERDRAQAVRDRAQAVRDKEQAVRDKVQAEKDRQQAMRDKMQAEKDMQQAMRDKQQAERDAEGAGRDKVQAEKERQQVMLDKQQAERDAKQSLLDKEQAEKDKAQAGRDKEQAERDQEQAVRDKEQAARDKVQAEEDKAMVRRVLAEVVKEGLAPDEKSVTSLVLDESVFYVNGKKQSDELQKKFREKFFKKEGYSIHYHNGRSSVGRMED